MDVRICFKNVAAMFIGKCVVNCQLLSLPINTYVIMKIFNIRGQEIASLINGDQPAGRHSVIWNGKNSNGQSVSTGIYFYHIQINQWSKTRKLVLLK